MYGHAPGGLADHGDELALKMGLASAWRNHDRVPRMTQRRGHFVKNLRALRGLTPRTAFRHVERIVEAQRQEFAGRARHQQFDGVDGIDHTGRRVIPKQVALDSADIFALGNAVFDLTPSLETGKFHI